MDSAANVLLASHHLYARSGGIGGDPNARPPVYKAVGISLAIASGVFIGISFVVKKVGLLKANEKYNEEAGEGYGYLKNAWWWLGMILMIIGEVCNFVAYAFVDAILVTPMGALSVVITAILSAIFLKERLSFVGKVGCFNCIIGSIVIVINAPEQSAVATIQDMKKLVISPGFLSYAGVIIVGCTVVALWLGPKYGKKTMMVYLSICSLIGGLSVVATQGLGAAIVAQIAGKSQFKEWFLYVLLVFVIATLLTEIIYLNVSRSRSITMLSPSPDTVNDQANKQHTESTQPLQRRPRHAHLLRLLHLLHHRHLRHPLPRLQRHRLHHQHRDNGLPPNLRRRRPPPALQIRKRRPRHRRLQGRPRPGPHRRRAGRTRVRASRGYDPRRCQRFA